MIEKEAWYRTSNVPPELIALFRQWDSQSLSDAQFKERMNDLIGDVVSQVNSRSKTKEGWVAALKDARQSIGLIAARIEELTRGGELPTIRLNDALTTLRQVILSSMDYATGYGSAPTPEQYKQAQDYAVKLFSKYLPGRPVPNIEPPAGA